VNIYIYDAFRRSCTRGCITDDLIEVHIMSSSANGTVHM
jgi:hypothetical protein